MLIQSVHMYIVHVYDVTVHQYIHVYMYMYVDGV